MTDGLEGRAGTSRRDGEDGRWRMEDGEWMMAGDGEEEEEKVA